MLNVSLLISTAHSSAQPEVHKQPPWPLAPPRPAAWSGHMVGPPGPEGSDPKCFQPGVLFGVLVNDKDSRCVKQGEALPSVADTCPGDRTSF